MPKVDSAKGRAARTRTADNYAREVGRIALAALRATDNPASSHAATVLTARGIRTPRGSKWTRDAVRSLIQHH